MGADRDALVERVAVAIAPGYFDPSHDDDELALALRNTFRQYARDAIAACQSELLAQGMEKAGGIIAELEKSDEGPAVKEYWLAFMVAREAIRASAAQTREGKGP